MEIEETKEWLMKLLNSNHTQIVRPLEKLQCATEQSRSASGLTVCKDGEHCSEHDFYETSFKDFMMMQSFDIEMMKAALPECTVERCKCKLLNLYVA